MTEGGHEVAAAPPSPLLPLAAAGATLFAKGGTSNVGTVAAAASTGGAGLYGDGLSAPSVIPAVSTAASSSAKRARRAVSFTAEQGAHTVLQLPAAAEVFTSVTGAAQAGGGGGRFSGFLTDAGEMSAWREDGGGISAHAYYDPGAITAGVALAATASSTISELAVHGPEVISSGSAGSGGAGSAGITISSSSIRGSSSSSALSSTSAVVAAAPFSAGALSGGPVMSMGAAAVQPPTKKQVGGVTSRFLEEALAMGASRKRKQ